MDVNEKLVNVRRATRLLASYYRRVVDIITLLDSTLESQARFKLKFLRWDATHHRHIGQQTTSVLGRWGWDFLPIQDATFQWTTGGKKSPTGPGSVYVGMWHQTDDAYESRDDETEPVAHEFRPAAESKTLIHVYVFGVVQGDTPDRWHAVESLGWRSLADSECWDHQLHEVPVDALDEADPGTQIRYLGWRIPMAELETEDDVEARILAPLRTALDQIVAANPL